MERKNKTVYEEKITYGNCLSFALLKKFQDFHNTTIIKLPSLFTRYGDPHFLAFNKKENVLYELCKENYSHKNRNLLFFRGKIATTKNPVLEETYYRVILDKLLFKGLECNNIIAKSKGTPLFSFGWNDSNSLPKDFIGTEIESPKHILKYVLVKLKVNKKEVIEVRKLNDDFSIELKDTDILVSWSFIPSNIKELKDFTFNKGSVKYIKAWHKASKYIITYLPKLIGKILKKIHIMGLSIPQDDLNVFYGQAFRFNYFCGFRKYNNENPLENKNLKLHYNYDEINKNEILVFYKETKMDKYKLEVVNISKIENFKDYYKTYYSLIQN